MLFRSLVTDVIKYCLTAYFIARKSKGKKAIILKKTYQNEGNRKKFNSIDCKFIHNTFSATVFKFACNGDKK